jgi:micrococcal nuclease
LPVGSKFTVRNPKVDFYGRTMGLVYNSKNANLNEVQVSSGFAVAYRKEAGCDWALALESQAKAKRLNIWSDPKFVLPDEWKRLNPN